MPPVSRRFSGLERFIVAAVKAEPQSVLMPPDTAEKVIVEYVNPPPWNVLTLDVPVKLSVDELALNVKLVVVPASHTVPTPVIVHVPFPRFIVRVPVPEMLTVPTVKLGLLVAKVSVPVKAPHVRDVTPVNVAAAVTVPPPEPPSNVTVSAAPGTL